jgi:hypothetical protein
LNFLLFLIDVFAKVEGYNLSTAPFLPVHSLQKRRVLRKNHHLLKIKVNMCDEILLKML